ncbi:MAG TPA: hypothetical protein VKX25_01545 [Bryobacteraceae bacterium]|jgi:hypothetical protein|nr:hypothetical protein [Bryobacteraceae bacterium]
MNRRTQMINDRYEAMMFAKSAEQARASARELIRVVLGDEAAQKPLEEALRECCRVMRPSHDPREQQRFEEEFIELGIWPNSGQQMAA